MQQWRRLREEIIQDVRQQDSYLFFQPQFKFNIHTQAYLRCQNMQLRYMMVDCIPVYLCSVVPFSSSLASSRLSCHHLPCFMFTFMLLLRLFTPMPYFILFHSDPLISPSLFIYFTSPFPRSCMTVSPDHYSCSCIGTTLFLALST